MVSKSTVKYIQSLQQKKFRDASSVFIAEGPKVVSELIDTGSFELKALYATAGWIEDQHLKVGFLDADRIYEVSDNELKRLSGMKTPHACLAVFSQREISVPAPDNHLMLMLDDIQDPGNLGTMIRTADWFGIKQIICSPHTADCYNPKVVQSTMASLGRVDLLYTNLSDWLKKHEEKMLLCATLYGKPIHEVEVENDQVLVIGNESKGISNEIINRASECITIPKYGKAESLNAAVAAGIMMSHFVNQ